MKKAFLVPFILIAYLIAVITLFNSYPLFNAPPRSSSMPFLTIQQYVTYVWILAIYGCLSGVITLVFPVFACWSRFGGRLVKPLFLFTVIATIVIEIVSAYKVGIELPLSAIKPEARLLGSSMYVFLAVLETIWYGYLIPIFIPIVSAEVVVGIRKLRSLGPRIILYCLLCLIILRPVYYILTLGINVAISKYFGILSTLLYFRKLNPELAEIIAQGKLSVSIFVPTIGWLVSTIVTLWLAYLLCSKAISRILKTSS